MMNKLLIIFLLFSMANMKEGEPSSPIYNLRINHLKEPFGIDIHDNIFSFLSNEEGPFKASIVLDNKIIQTSDSSVQ